MSELSTELKSLLGTENKTGWIDFMDRVTAELPFLSAPGRPLPAAVAASPVGQAGYKSWRDYVADELSWSYASWSAWKKAYKLVLAHPYLRELDLTASEINTRAKLPDFPASTDLYMQEKADAKAKVAEKKEASTAALTQRITELETTLRARTNDLTTLRARVDAFNARNWFARAFAQL